MNIHTSKKTSFTLSAVALAFLSCGPHVVVVDGLYSFETTVQCLPESSEVCIGLAEVYGPSPVYNDENGETKMEGGYGWSWQFVDGLKEGENDEDTVVASLNGMTVDVIVDEDDACEILINGLETCRECAHDRENGMSRLEYDCTNVENGKKSPEPYDVMVPFLYPFVLDDVLCFDDPDFLWKGKGKKNCDWAGKGKSSRIKNKCNRKADDDGKHVYDYCPFTCVDHYIGTCSPPLVCPGHDESEYCDCGGDCTMTNFCDCDEGQKCCEDATTISENSSF